MSYFTELLEVSSSQALVFFVDNLEDEAVQGATRSETIYIAGILAHYAQVSTGTIHSMPPAVTLYDILDHFVLPGLTTEGAIGLEDPEILEIAGSQTLLLAGFFRDQMKKRHNVRWYDNLGQGFFEKASERFIGGPKAHLLARVAEHFPLWTQACARTSRHLRQKRYLLEL